MKSHSFHDAFNDRYAPPAWALFYEVGDGTGAKKNRSADAIAMSLYPSRGLDLYGHEFKANRGDWIKELKDPDKAESIARFCDFWYAVDTNGGKAIREEEVPPRWGLMVWNGKTLRAVKAAERLEPIQITRAFLAGFLRAAHKTVEVEQRKTKDEGWIQHLDTKSYDRGYKTAEDVLISKWEGVQKKNEVLEKVLSEFQEKSGIRINEWNWGPQAEAIRCLERMMAVTGLHSQIENEGRRLKEIAESILQLSGAVKILSEKSKVQGTVGA